MNRLPAVTIMIPTYNQANVLPKALESALAQDYDNFEVVVSDDCSTDNTQESVQKFLSDRRLKYSRSSRNLGRVGNYKYMLKELAKGDWVINLDADDYFTDFSFIRRYIDLILANQEEQIVFVQAGHQIREDDGLLIRNELPNIRDKLNIMDGKTYFLQFSHFSHLATLYNRKLALSVDFYRFDILSSDIESFLRLALLGAVILVREVVGVWMHHDENESKRLDVDVLDKNLKSFERPYSFAKSGEYIPLKKLNAWRRRMIDRHLIQHFHAFIRLGLPTGPYILYIYKKYPRLFFRISFLKGFLKMIWHTKP